MDFDTSAADWDTDRRVKRAKIIAEEIAKSIKIQGRMSALEFGCGTGLVSFFLYDRFSHITLIDTSKGMIDTLEQKIRASGIQNMNAIHMDINRELSPERTDIEPSGNTGKMLPSLGTFDVIYTSMAMHHIRDIETTLKNLYKKLNRNGQLCIVDLTEDDGSFHRLEKDFDGHNGFDQERLKLIMEDAGFRNAASRVFFEDSRLIGDLNVPYSLFILTGVK